MNFTQEQIDEINSLLGDVSLEESEDVSYDDIQNRITPTSGVTGAFGSSVDRIQAGLYQLIGDDENAERNIRESQAYMPTVASYKDIDGIGSGLTYLAELGAQALPYAPAMLAGPKGIAAAVALGATEAGATYASQTEKSVPRAIASAGINTILERVPGLKTLTNSPLITRTVANTIGEATRGATQHMVDGVVGHNLSTEDAMRHIDEAIVGGTVMRNAMDVGAAGVRKVADVIPARVERDSNTRDFDAISRERSDAEIAAELDGRTLSFDEKWQAGHMNNKYSALNRVVRADVPITAAALDVKGRSGNKLYEDLGFSKRDVQKAQTARTVAEAYDVPIIGGLLGKGDPVEAAKAMNEFTANENANFKTNLSEQLSVLNLSARDELMVRNDLQAYANGDIGGLSTQVKNILGEKDPNFRLVDEAQQMLDINRMNQAMLTKETGGIGAGVGGVLDILATGGAITTTGVASTVAGRAGVRKGQEKIKNIFKDADELEVNGKKFTADDVAALMEALGKAGIQTSDFEEEYKLE